jgi:tripartite-type tricarboxylate transporter receptor subunit TctC
MKTPAPQYSVSNLPSNANARKRRFILALALSCIGGTTLSFFPGPAMAQPFPAKAITLVHPFGPGSGADQIARTLGEEVTKMVGVPVIIDARPGGNGMIAMQAVKRAPPDGYTVMLTTNTTQVLNALLYRDLAIDPVAEFVPVTGLTIIYQVMVVAAASPANNYSEFLALARKNPGMSFGSGTAAVRVSGELFKQMAKVEMLNVPYKSTPPALIDVMGGRIDVAFAALVESGALIQAGKLKPLAVTSPRRLPSLPNVPTLDELGLKGYANGVWSGIFSPHGTPEATVTRLHEIFSKANATPAMAKIRSHASSEMLALNGPELAKFQAADIVRAKRVAAAAGIVPE